MITKKRIIHGVLIAALLLSGTACRNKAAIDNSSSGFISRISSSSVSSMSEESSSSQQSSVSVSSQPQSSTASSSKPSGEIPNPVLDTKIADNAILFGSNNNEFPMGLWSPTRYEHLNEAVYKDIKDSYFNFAVDEEAIYGGLPMMLQNMDYAQKYGIKLWINDPKIRAMNSVNMAQKITDMVASYKDHPAFIGNVFVDEPDKSTMDKMLGITKEYEKQLPGKMPYINLLPDYASETQMGFVDWGEHIEYYLKTYNPKYVSYDYYPLMKENKYMGFGFVKSLNQIAKISQKYNVPLWTTLQSVPASLTARALTATDIRWQMYMNLAFGTKGITYWLYATATEHNEIPDALINRSGAKTDLWYSVRDINKEISNFSKILLTLSYKGVLINSSVGGDFSYAINSFSPVQKTEGGEYIVGCLEDSKGSKKLMAVNLGIENKSEVKITIDRAKSNYYHIWKKGVRSAAWLDSDNMIKLTLEPGEGCLIELGGVK